MQRTESLEIDPTNIVNWSLTKEQKQCDGEKTVFSTKSSGTAGYTYTKKCKQILQPSKTLKVDHSPKC